LRRTAALRTPPGSQFRTILALVGRLRLGGGYGTVPTATKPLKIGRFHMFSKVSLREKRTEQANEGSL